MNASDANYLLLSLKAEVDRTDPAFLPENLQDKISFLFVQTILTGQVVPRASFRGRFATLFLSDKRIFAQNKKIIDTFSEAIKLTWNDSNANVLFKDKFFHDLRLEFKKIKVDRIPVKNEDLEEIRLDKQRLEQTKLYELSLFHKVFGHVPSVFDFKNTDVNLFKQIFEKSDEAFARTKYYFYEFLNVTPQYAGDVDLRDKIARIHCALDRDERLQKSMLNYVTPISKAERYQKIGEMADEMAREIQQLPTKKRWMCAGSFGSQINSIERLINKFRHLPKSTLEQLPSSLKEVVDGDVPLPDPKDFVAKSIQPHIDKLFSRIPGLDIKSEGAVESFLNFFLYDPDKKLPGVAHRLPKAVYDEMERLFQNGLFGNLVDFTEGSQRQLLEWICLNTETIKDVDKRKEVIANLGRQLSEYSINKLGDPKGKIDRNIKLVVDRLQKLVPRDLLTLSGLDAHLSTGQVWLEVERFKNGTCTVFVYGTGAALQYYSQDMGGNYSWPLKIENVPFAKLNAEFFRRFLFHRIEPGFDPSMLSRVDDLIEGPILGYLKSHGSSRGKDRVSKKVVNVDANITLPSEMAKQLIINPQYSHDRVAFEYQLQALIDYSRPHFKAGELVIPNDETEEAILCALNSLLKDFGDVRSKLDENYAAQIEATLKEVKEALFLYRRSQNEHSELSKLSPEDILLPEWIMKPLKSIAFTIGLTKEYAKAIQKTLCTAFGPQVKPLLEFIVKVLPIEGSKKVSQALPSAGVWEQKSRTIQFFTQTYVRIAFTVLRVLLALVNLFRESWSFFALLPGVKYILDNIIPAKYLTWYHEVMRKTRKLMIHGFLTLVVYCFFSKKTVDGLQDYLKNYLEPLQNAGERLNNRELFSFLIDESNRPDPPAYFLGTVSKDVAVPSINEMALDVKVVELATRSPSAADLQGAMDSWIENANGMAKNSSEQFLYLVSHLLSLETPVKGQIGAWDTVLEPEKCMEQLSILANLLKENAIVQTASGSKFYLAWRVAHYKVLAIMHTLAKQSLKDEMPSVPIDVSGFLLTIKDKVEDAFLWEQCKQIVSYFHPELDILNLPDVEQIEEIGYQSLFNYSKTVNLLRNVIRNSYQIAKSFGKFGLNVGAKTFDFVEKKYKKIEHRYSKSWAPPFSEKTSVRPGTFLDILKRLIDQPELNQKDIQELMQVLTQEGFKNWNKTEEGFDTIFKAINVLCEKVQYDEGSIEQAYFDFAINKLLLFMHDIHIAEEQNQQTDKEEPLSVDIKTIEKWLADKDRILKLHPHLWIGYYKMYEYCKKHCHTLPLELTEKTLREKKEKVVKFLNGEEMQFSISGDVRHMLFDASKMPSEELKFLTNQLQKPEIQEQLNRLDVDSNCSEMDKLRVLFLLSYFPLKNSLPKAWLLLRQQVLEAQLGKLTFSTDASINLTAPAGEDHWVSRLFEFTDTLEGSQNLIVPSQWLGAVQQAAKIDSETPKEPSLGMYQQKERDQAVAMSFDEHRFKDVVKKLSGWDKTSFLPEYLSPMELVTCSAKDRITRALHLFSQNKRLLYLHQDPGSEGQLHLQNHMTRFLEYCFFEAGHLERELKASPDLFRVMGEFLNDHLDYYYYHEKDTYTLLFLIRLSSKLQSYCQKYDPASLKYFPNLKEVLDKIEPLYEGSSHNRALFSYHVVQALSSDPALFQDQMWAAKHLCKMHAYHLDPSKCGQQDKGLLDDLVLDSKQSFSHWQTLIQDLLNSESRRDLILEFVKACGISLSQTEYADWKREGPWEFSSGDIRINLLEGIKHAANQLLIADKDIADMIEVKRALGDKISTLARANEAVWKTADNEYVVYIKPKSENVLESEKTVSICRKMDGRSYFYTSEPSEDMLTFFEEASAEVPPKARFWVEGPSSSTFKHILMQWQENDQQHELILKLKGTEDGKFQYYSQIIDREERVPVNLSHAQHHLHTLTRFCAAEEIVAWRCPIDECYLNGFRFKPYDLTFKVKRQGDKDLAYSRGKYPGYYISENQCHSAVRGISSYLLLESDNGAKKVLIPEGQWISSTLWRKLKGFGPLANFATDYLHYLDTNFVDKMMEMLGVEKIASKYFEYDIAADGSLNSEDPEAVAYLVMLNLMQDKQEATYKACEQLEKLAKRMPFSPAVMKMTFPLALVPFQFKDLRAIRMRVFAALEENRLVHKIEPENVQQDDSWYTHGVEILQGITSLIDLDDYIKNPKPQHRFTMSQEWFLYRSVFRTLRQVVDKGIQENGSSSTVNQAISKVGLDHLIEAVGLMPHLAERYRTIKKRLQLSDSKTLAWAHTAKTIWKTKSPLPNGASINQLINKTKGKAREANAEQIVNESDDDSSVFKRIIRMTKQTGNRLLDARLLKLDELKAEINTVIDPNPPLSLKDLTPELFKRNFLAYYRIAKEEVHINPEDDFNENLEEKKRLLKEMVVLMRGGWDSQTQALLYYLEAVESLPVLFPTTMEFSRALAGSQWQEFWLDVKGMRNRLITWQSARLGLPVAETMAKNYWASSGVMNTAKATLGVLSHIPLKGLTDHIVNLSAKSVTAAANWLFTDEVKESAIEATEPDYAAVREEDAVVDSKLEVAFHMIFRPEKPPQAWQGQAMGKMAHPADAEPILIERYKRVNKSIDDYYERDGRVPDLLRFKGEEGIWEGYVFLESFCSDYEKSIDAAKEDVLDYLNSQVRDAPTITIEQLEIAMHKGNYKALIDACQLRQDEALHITRILTMCLVKETRLLQMKRALQILEGLVQMKPGNEYKDNLESLVDELKTRRAYTSPEKIVPPRLFHIYLMIEKKTNKMIWQRQADYIARLLPEEITDAVGELLMSLGKTSTIIPAYSTFEADGTKPVFVLYPKAIAPTNIKSASDQAKAVFDQIIHGLMFSRTIPLNLEEIEALSVVFQASIKGDISSMTKEDAQALELIMEDRMYRYKRLPAEAKKSEKEAIDAFRKVLKLMRESKGIPDEAHDIFDCYQELNFPLGQESHIQNNLYRVIEHSMRLVADDTSLKAFIKGNNLLRVSAEALRDVIAPRIAEKMLDYPSFDLRRRNETEQHEFVQYVTGKLSYIPSWIQEDKKRYAEICMLKGVLTVLLKNAFERVVSVNFDASEDKKKGEFARPSDGNNNVNDDACIRSPYEALVKTFMMLLCKGLDEEQCLKLVEALHDKALQISKTRHIPIEQTNIYTKFSPLIKSCELFKTANFTQAQRKEIVEVIGKYPDAVQLYMRYFVSKQIPYWKLNLRSNSQNFASQFGTIVSDTGTPYNDGTYPVKCKMIWDPGTIGEALDILKRKCPPNGIHVLDKDSPKDVLEEILKDYFQRDSNFTAIIDGGALFKGLSNEYVAKQMLKHAETHMPHIKAVKFFKKDAQGKDQLVWLERGSNEATAIDDARIPPKNCISYFDQKHGFASNIPQKGDGVGLELLGEQALDQTLQRYLQDTFRMRGLKQQQRVDIGSGQIDRTQTIHFAMTKAARDKITRNEKPTLEEIFAFGIKNEAARAQEDNYIAQIHKIHDVVRRAVLDKILEAPNVDAAIQMFEAFSSVLISKLEDDPIKLYSLIEEQVSYKIALEAAVKLAKSQVDPKYFSAEEQENINKRLDALANPAPETMPTKVSVCRKGAEVCYDLKDDLDRQTQVYEQSGETQVETEEDVEIEQEQNQRNTLQQQKNRYVEHQWNEDLDAMDIDWMRIKCLVEYQDHSLKAQMVKFLALITDINELTFPLFYMYDLLANAALASLRDVADAFDKRIWCSNNFIPKQVANNQDPVDAGSAHQKDLFEVLIHFDGDNIAHIAPLTVQESTFWKAKLANMQGAKQKIILYDIQSRFKVAGSDVSLDALRANQDLCKLETMLLFLDGRVHYPKELLPALKDWLQSQNVVKMKEAFLAIHQQRNKGMYEGSDIARVFDDLLNVSWVDSI